MSEIQRYRVNPMMWVDRKGWKKTSVNDKPFIHAIEQKHKKGGWCKWSDAQKLEKQLKTSRQSESDLEDMLVALREEHEEEMKEARKLIKQTVNKNCSQCVHNYNNNDGWCGDCNNN